MRAKKIFPAEWLAIKPYNNPDSVDLYYVGLANKVMGFLEKSELADYFKDELFIRKASLYLVSWFEDVCSNLGMWALVNKECLVRYGSKLPFYDVSKYYEGEVNPQDLSLLLWHFMQVYNEKNTLLNPENPWLLKTALELTNLFDEEYESAPENERLHAFIHNDFIGDNWWECRKLMEWFHMSSYVFLGAPEAVAEAIVDSEYKGMPLPKRMYMAVTEHMFNYKHNLLSLNVQQWLGKITENAVFDKIERSKPSMFMYKGQGSTTFRLYDMVEGKEYGVDMDSFAEGESSIRNYVEDKTLVYTTLVKFNGKYFISGMMTELRGVGNAKINDAIEEMRIQRALESQQKDNYPVFLAASGGEPAVILRDRDAVKKFFVEKLKFTNADEFDMPPIVSNAKCYAIYGDPINGLCISPNNGQCLAIPGNKFYKKDAAKKDGISFYVNNGTVPYRVACMLHDKGLIPDAAINSLKGYEYGRDFLHRNGDFFLDYFYHATREYDLFPFIAPTQQIRKKTRH